MGLLAIGWPFYGGENVPAGQPPLVSLTSSNFDQLRAAFNSASGVARTFLLLSNVTDLSAGVFRSSRCSRNYHLAWAVPIGAGPFGRMAHSRRSPGSTPARRASSSIRSVLARISLRFPS
jgi:hypothetical protein